MGWSRGASFGVAIGLAVAGGARADEAIPPAAAPSTNVAAPSMPAGAQPKIVPFLRFVPSGVEHRIGIITLVNPDCSAVGDIVGRVQKAPQHGQLSFAQGDDYTIYPPNNPREACNSKRLPSFKIMYKSEGGYTGKDEANVFLIFPDSTAAEWDFTIDVR